MTTKRPKILILNYGDDKYGYGFISKIPSAADEEFETVDYCNDEGMDGGKFAETISALGLANDDEVLYYVDNQVPIEFAKALAKIAELEDKAANKETDKESDKNSGENPSQELIDQYERKIATYQNEIASTVAKYESKLVKLAAEYEEELNGIESDYDDRIDALQNRAVSLKETKELFEEKYNEIIKENEELQKKIDNYVERCVLLAQENTELNNDLIFLKSCLN